MVKLNIFKNRPIQANSDRISVLFVCMGNICRSPTAEGVFRRSHISHLMAFRSEQNISWMPPAGAAQPRHARRSRAPCPVRYTTSTAPDATGLLEELVELSVPF